MMMWAMLLVVGIVGAWPQDGCLDNRGSFVADGATFLDDSRNVVRKCVVVDVRSFTFDDVACQIPGTARQLFAGQTLILGDAEYRCNGYTAGGYPRLRLLRRDLPADSPALKRAQSEESLQIAVCSCFTVNNCKIRCQENLPLTWDTVQSGNQNRNCPASISLEVDTLSGSVSVRQSLPRSRFCFENGQLYADGDEWTSDDGSLRMGCQKDGLAANAVALYCFTPAAAKIPAGTAVSENGRLYSCRAEADGRLWREEATAARDLSAPCRRSQAELARVQRENEQIVAQNKRIVETRTTAAEAAEFRRLILTGKPYEYQATNYYKVLQSLQSTRPLPPLQCKDSNSVSVYMVGCEGRC